MKPILFLEHNCVYAKNQPEYLPLPVYKSDDGMVIICWKLTFLERIKLLFGCYLWHSIKTFNQPLQPIRLSVRKPI